MMLLAARKPVASTRFFPRSVQLESPPTGPPVELLGDAWAF